MLAACVENGLSFFLGGGGRGEGAVFGLLFW